MKTASPNPEEATKFWSNIWVTNVNHNDQAESIRRIEEKFQVDKQEDINITRQNVAHQVRNMAKWKGPGPDGVQGYQLKTFTFLLSLSVWQKYWMNV